MNISDSYETLCWNYLIVDKFGPRFELTAHLTKTPSIKYLKEQVLNNLALFINLGSSPIIEMHLRCGDSDLTRIRRPPRSVLQYRFSLISVDWDFSKKLFIYAKRNHGTDSLSGKGKRSVLNLSQN